MTIRNDAHQLRLILNRSRVILNKIQNEARAGRDVDPWIEKQRVVNEKFAKRLKKLEDRL